LLVSWHIMKREDFMGCSKASIGYTGHRRIIHLFGKFSTKGIMDMAMWYV
jgi:hypothetical protein